MNTQSFLAKIRELIAANELAAALLQLRALLNNSPLLDEALVQSARFQDIRKQIRLGTVSHADANLTENQIRAGLIDLLREIEARDGQPDLKAEIEQAVSIVHSKNVAAGHFSAGGNISIGDRTETHHHYGDRIIPRALTPNPFQPEVFIGREHDVQAIHDKLFTPGSNLLLLVNGHGGVGKTTLASKYYHTFQDKYAHSAWVLSEKNLAAALLLLAIPLGLSFDERMPEAERLQTLLREMAALDRPCLLVIDNANELEDLEKHYQNLRRCTNFHLLLTSRITEFGQAEHYPVEGLPEPEALQLFRKYYPKLQPEEEVVFKEIRAAVGGNTLVVELLAKNLALFNRLKTRYTLPDLLADLQQKGLLRLSQSQAVDTDYQSRGNTMRREKPEDIIAAMYDLGELPPEETSLLSVLAVLPAESIPFAMLETLLPEQDELDTRLLSLAKKGWIEYSETDASFKISPVVQEIARQKNPNLSADCRTLVYTLNEKLDYETGTGHFINVGYEEAGHFARFAETLLATLVKPATNLSILCERTGSYHNTTGNLERAFFFFEKNVEIGKLLCAAEPDNTDFKNSLAISYSKLGNTHSVLGDLEKALGYYELDKELTKELYAAYPNKVEFKNNLAISYCYLGDTHSALGDLEKALGYYEQDKELEKELNAAYPNNVSFKNGLAISYSNLGDTHSALGDLEKALGYYEEYKELKNELYAAYPNNVSFKNGLAISYEKLGQTHTALGDLEKALTFFDLSYQILRELNDSFAQNVEFKNNLAEALKNLGEFNLNQLQDKAQAKTYFQQAERLWVELVRDAPQVVQYQRFLGFVRKVLAGWD